MSASLGDTSYELYSNNAFAIVSIVLLIGFYLSAMKMCFGTYFIRTAFGNYKQNKGIQKRYYEMFGTRDNLMYHISWAKSRRDMEEARNLLKQLDHVDKVRCSLLTVFFYIMYNHFILHVILT